MSYNLNQLKELRQRTGAGIVDAKKALEESAGNIEKAEEILRRQGMKVAAKKGARQAGEGLVAAYIHPGGKVGVLVKVACETDFVARTDEFKSLVHEIAMQVAALAPKYIRPEEVPTEEVDKEKSIYKDQLHKEGKPAEIIEKIIDGKLKKFYQEVCLLNQPWIKDDKKTIQDLINEATAKLGERIEVKEFARFAV